MGSLHKNIQLMLEFLKVLLSVLLDDVICNIAIFADDTTLFFKCNQESDMQQWLELASELESNLQDRVAWGKEWLANFNAVKTQLVLFDQSNNSGTINVKMDRLLTSPERWCIFPIMSNFAIVPTLPWEIKLLHFWK